MRIYIDNAEADMDQATNVAISLSVASHTSLETSKTGYVKTITIPMTQANKAIMGDGEQLNSPAMFNHTDHTATVEQDGFTVIEGTPRLVEASCTDEGGYYKINIVGAGMKWVKYAAETRLSALDMDFAATADAETVAQSWTWNKPVRFLPVMRDGFEPENVNNGLFGVQKILTFEDYHPFLHVKTIVNKIFADAGYALESKFLSGAMFDTLYMSGNYPVTDTARIKARMDFRAGRFASATATADYLGRVYATPYSNLGSSLGNIVQTADPDETLNGSTVAGVYSVDYCFRKNDSHVEYVPPAGVTVGFEYALYYTTDYYLKNSSELTGFDTVYIGGGQQKKFTLANRFTDRRNNVENGKSFKIAIFDFDSAATYRPFYKVITNPAADLKNLKAGDYTEVMGPVVASRLFPCIFSAAGTIADFAIKEYRSGAWAEYTGDWALYDGYVEETGTVDVEIKLRSAAERVVPSQPKTFYDVWFGGAQPGMNLTLGKQTTLRPIFAQAVGEGTAVDFAKVANHGISCLDLINAIKQMFNLYFLTDQFTRKVYVEPRKDFHTATVIDWSDRVDFSKPIVVSDPGTDNYRRIVFGYACGDDAVAAWNRTYEDAFGEWQAAVRNSFAKDGTRTYENPVFTASVSRKDVLDTAPSALMLHAGGTDDDEGDMNFPPKIVRYMGMAELPRSESWGWPSGGTHYPLLAFHYEGDDNPYQGSTPNPLSTYDDIPTLLQNGFSLCFEDRGGVAGIHRFWDGNIDILNNGKRVEMSLMLYPEDIEAMLSPNTLGRDFRAMYRFVIDGESVLLRLEEICDYNPAAGGSTKCVFIKE